MMVKVGLNNVKSVRLGSMNVSRLMLGDRKVWPEARLDLSPDTIWLLRANDWTDYVEILSNVEWHVG
jgi:hypothetical protein